jgi:hypothetical protein
VAENHFQAALDAEPANHLAMVNLGTVAYHRNDLLSAESTLIQDA